MNNKAAYLIDRQQQLDAFVQFHLGKRNREWQDRSIALYFYPFPKELQLQQDNLYLINHDLYREDHGTFLFLLSALKDHFQVTSPQAADFIVIPFNLYFHSKTFNIQIRDVVKNARKIAGNRPLIFFSIGDFCLKTMERSTLFERSLFESLDNKEEYQLEWILPTDIFIHFESTIDFLFQDISIFPLIQADPVPPFNHERQFLFSFIGEQVKEGWPEGFVRSPSRKPTWQKLSTAERGLVLTTAEAKERFQGNPFITVPQQSIFTLCPRGISSWSFRLFEAILSGSIPVILSDSYHKPCSDIIPWDYFSLSFPEHYLGKIDTVLAAIQPRVIKALQLHLEKNQHWFTAPGLISLITKKLRQAKEQIT